MGRILTVREIAALALEAVTMEEEPPFAGVDHGGPYKAWAKLSDGTEIIASSQPSTTEELEYLFNGGWHAATTPEQIPPFAKNVRGRLFHVCRYDVDFEDGSAEWAAGLERLRALGFGEPQLGADWLGRPTALVIEEGTREVCGDELPLWTRHEWTWLGKEWREERALDF